MSTSTPTRKARLGIFGGGGILGAHAPGYRAIPDLCEVVAVAEPNAARHDRVRQLVGDVKIVRDYQELLATVPVDAVDILLPHDLHLPATLAAAAARKPVLIEKVMARNIHECDQMIAACDRAGVSLTVCHDRRYDGAWMALKEVVDSGALGEIFWWKLEHNQDVNCRKVLPWAASRDRLGGGAIMSCLTHQIDALRWYGGEVASVVAMTKVLPDRMEGETAGVVAATMRSGALANLTINWFTRSNGGANCLWYELVQACGSRGEAYYMSGKGTFVRLHDATQTAAVERFGQAALEGFAPVPAGNWRGHVRCVGEWVKSLVGLPAQVVTSGRDVRGTVEVAEAADLAAARGVAVTLPIPATPWPAPAAAQEATR